MASWLVSSFVRWLVHWLVDSLIGLFVDVRVCVCVCVFVFFVWQGLNNSSVATKEFFAKDLKLVKVILEACEAVFNPDSAGLDRFKARFVDGASSSATHSSGSQGGDGAKVATLGSAPPIGKTQDLTVFAKIDKIPSTVYERIKVKEDYQPLREELSVMLQPIKELSAACKRHTLSLKTRKEDKEKLKSQKFGDISAPTAPCYIYACLCICFVFAVVRDVFC